MALLMIYSEDGSLHPGMTYDPNMVSVFAGGQAVETWQIGYVKQELAVRLKTISSLRRLLRQAVDGDLLEVRYRSRMSQKEIKETLVVHLVGHHIQPLLMGVDLPALSDTDVVRLLEVGWGKYITVTYRLVSRHDAVLVPFIPPGRFAEQTRAEALAVA